MNDDDLRAKLTVAICEFFDAHEDSTWDNVDLSDALMPVVREALAQAWDEGEAAGMGQMNGADTSNPWREGRP